MTYPVDFCLDFGSINSGLSLTATIKTMAGAAFASGVTGWTEDPAGSGIYWGTYSAFVDEAHYRMMWFSGADLVAAAPISPLIYTVAVGPTVDLAALATAMASALGGAPVTITSPVAQSGNVSIIRGDDYANADGRALEWTNPAGTWPDLTGATITLAIDLFGTAFVKTGSVVVGAGVGQKVRVELTAAEDATIPPGGWLFDVRAALVTSGRKITLIKDGTWVALASRVP